MPLIATSFFLPASPALPFILEDIYVKGGYKVIETIAERDGLHPFARKEGMLVFVKEDKKLYQMQEDLQAWEVFKTGGGVEKVAEPLYIQADGTLAIREEFVVPQTMQPGQIMEADAQSKVIWVDKQASTGTRGTIEYESPTVLNLGETIDFDLDMPKSILLIKVKLNTPGIQIEGFSTALKEDKNPYTFISHPDYMFDEGVTVADVNTLEKHRRYSFLSNQETPTLEKHYFRFTNKGDVGIKPKVTIEFLTLE